MKKFPLLICLLILAACSKNEVIPPLDDLSLPTSSVVVSHLDNDDLILVDGLIQLKISREDAIERGVPASEYDLVEETLIKHNKNKFDLLKKAGKSVVQTKSEMYGNTMAFGMLQDPPYERLNYTSIPLSVANEEGGGGIILSCTFSSNNTSDFDRHVLKYQANGLGGAMGEIEEYGYTIEDYPFPNFIFGWMTLEYTFYGSSYGICVYEVYDNT